MATDYQGFTSGKLQLTGDHGFAPSHMPDFLFDFQAALVEWSLRLGRAAIFADCGLGKTPIQLVWADNVVRRTNGRVLILTPLAVAVQTVHEGEKFGVEVFRSSDGKFPASARVVVTNYERLQHFDPSDFDGVVCDESSILKNFNGKTKSAVTEFMRLIKYRLLCTATASPNDHIELGTSSEALGYLGFQDMLSKFFKKDDKKTTTRAHEFRAGVYRFRGHAELSFWRWVCSWARAVRRPSDLGFDDSSFTLPPLETVEHVIEARTLREGMLFETAAVGLFQQREERRRTMPERCEKVAELISDTDEPAVAWCHLNAEGDMLQEMMPDALQVAGSDCDDHKVSVFETFAAGDCRVIITKPKIAGFGLNWQHCAHQTFFPSHSFEQWYQAVRRCWRFGQKRPVRVDIVTSEGELGIRSNLERKAQAADDMFAKLVGLMNQGSRVEACHEFNTEQEVPGWL